MLFNYRMSNLCVKAEPTALMPVTVFVAGTEYNLEEVANILKPDDFSFDVYPKNQNNLQDIISGIFDVHPEFKMELKTDKAEMEGGADTQHVFYTMPPVDKDRRKLLNETTKTFHKECMVNLDVTYAELQARLVELKKVYDDARDECDKMLQLKLNEIEEGYQRYLTEYNDRYAEPETDDHEMEVSEDPEIDALFK